MIPFKKVHIIFLKKLNILTRSNVNGELVPLFHCRDCKIKVLPPSVSREYFGHLRVMLPCLDYLVEISLTRVSVLDRYSGHWPLRHLNTKHKYIITGLIIAL